MAQQVSGVVEQPVGDVVGGGVRAQLGDGGGERRAGGRVAAGGGEAGAGQVAFGALHGGQFPGLVFVEHGQQLGGGVGEVVGGAGRQRPGPPQELLADHQGIGLAEDGAGVAERGFGLAAGDTAPAAAMSALSWRSSLARRSASPARAAWAVPILPRGTGLAQP